MTRLSGFIFVRLIGKNTLLKYTLVTISSVSLIFTGTGHLIS